MTETTLTTGDRIAGRDRAPVDVAKERSDRFEQLLLALLLDKVEDLKERLDRLDDLEEQLVS